jgi:hypothetical protein
MADQAKLATQFLKRRTASGYAKKARAEDKTKILGAEYDRSEFL